MNKNGENTMEMLSADIAAVTGDAALQEEGAKESARPPLWTALTSYLIGYLYVACFLLGFALDRDLRYSYSYGPRSGAQLLFAAIFLLWGTVVIPKTQKCKVDPPSELAGERRCGREHFFWAACMLVIAAALAAGRSTGFERLSIAALHGCAAYWVVCRSGMLTERITGPFVLWDIFSALVVAPFGGIFLRLTTLVYAVMDAVRAVRRRYQGRLCVKSVGISVCFLVLALPFLGMAGSLLSQADSVGFAGFWQGVNELLRFDLPPLPDWVGEVFFRFLLSLPVGAYLYGLVCGSALRQKPVLRPAAVRREAEQLRVVPMGGAALVFGLFCGLYAVFFMFQAGHLFGAFFGVVPGSATASEYAREGFFQLCQVMVINFGLLTAAAKCSRTPLRKNQTLRILALLLMVESLLLAATAGSKLWLYIDRFGFTPLRLLSSWAVLALAAGCVLAICTILKPFRAVQKWVWFAAGSFALLCLF